MKLAFGLRSIIKSYRTRQFFTKTEGLHKDYNKIINRDYHFQKPVKKAKKSQTETNDLTIEGLKSRKANAQQINNLLFSMPKEEKHLGQLKEQRMEKRYRRPPGQLCQINWQVIGSGCEGGPSTLVLYTDHRRYLFNCGEGSQRLITQLSISRTLAQMENIFLTSKTWRNMGGLPGLCLSIRSAGAPDVTVHGPKGVMDIYEATKGFLLLFEFDVLAHNGSDVFDDGSIKVDSVELARNCQKPVLSLNQSPWNVDYLEGFDDPEKVNPNVRRSKPVGPPSETAMAYIIAVAPKKGKLNASKCVEMGVPPGPLLGKLKNGEDITLDNGDIIKSTDVCDPEELAKNFLVVEAPDTEYLESLITNNKLQEAKNDPSLEVVFHFTEGDVLRHPVYKKWMHEFPGNVQHVLINAENKGLGLTSVTTFQTKLNHIHPSLFPLLKGSDDPTPDEPILENITSQYHDFHASVIRARHGLKYNVRPSHVEKVDISDIPLYDMAKDVAELLEDPAVDETEKITYAEGMKEDLKLARGDSVGVLSLTQQLQEVDGLEVQEGGDPRLVEPGYPQVRFLGTGSSVPSKYRNVTGILVELEEGRFFLMDCGEGTVAQLYRNLGAEGANKALIGLKAVFLSHQHADHHLGLISVIQAREKAFKTAGKEIEKMYIIATDKMGWFLSYYHRMFEPILCNAVQVKNEHLVLYSKKDIFGVEDPSIKSQPLYPEDLSSLCKDLGLSSIETCRAIHCPHAFCLSFTTDKMYKIVFSGDTRPCPALVNLGKWKQSPDLLIHEATMEHYMQHDAQIKKHSTITEAVQVGEEMGAKFTLLTHFSQRYSKMPVLGEVKGKDNVGVAFDNMVVGPNNMRMIKNTYPALERFLWEHLIEMDDKKAGYLGRFGHPSNSSSDGEDNPFLKKKKILLNKLNAGYERKEARYDRINKRRQWELQLEQQKGKKAKTSWPE